MNYSGIYSIVNSVSKKIYIGSAVNLNRRWIYHKSDLRRNKHGNQRLQMSFNKHGLENFNFNILARCPKEYLIKMEQWFLDNVKPEYNICRIAGSTLGKSHSEATRKKISILNKGRVMSEQSRKNISKGITGRKHSDISKKKRAKSMKKNWEEYKATGKIRITRKYPVFQYTVDGDFVRKHNSAKEAALFVNGSISHISSLLNESKVRKVSAGFQWKKYYCEKIPAVHYHYKNNSNNNFPT